MSGDRFDSDPGQTTRELPAIRTLSPPGPPLSARLVVIEGNGAGRSVPVRDSVTVGRAESCELRVDDGSVSRHHARLVAGPRGLVVEDLGSRNGTFLNGRRVKEPTPVRLGDRIALGQSASLLVTHDHPVETLLRERQQLEGIGRIAAGVSHDFNNLVGAAVATVSVLRVLLEDATVDAEVEECLDDLELVLGRAADLTRALGSLGRKPGAAGPTPVDASEVCAELARLCERTFGASYEIGAQIDPGLIVGGDPTELHQILLNLCLNSRDAMPQGGRLQISAQRAPDPDTGESAVIISIADTGHGMDAETVARIFEPFFTTKPEGRGTGLGLATVAELARAMGARVDVESAPSEGTTFRVRCPELVGVKSGTSRPPPTSSNPPPEVPEGHVLVVDDQALVRRSVGRVLSARGHSIIYARDGREALRLVQRTQPPLDVVLLDLALAGMGGEELLRRIVELEDPPMVLIVSGSSDPDRLAELREAGAAGYFAKPFDVTELRNTVDTLITEVRARRGR